MLVETHAQVFRLRPSPLRQFIPGRHDLRIGMRGGLPGVVAGMDMPEANHCNTDHDDSPLTFGQKHHTVLIRLEGNSAKDTLSYYLAISDWPVKLRLHACESKP